MKKEKLLKILVPIIMVLIVAAIWLLQDTKDDEMTQSSDIPSDFLLYTDSIDLPALQAYDLPIIIDFGADSCGPCVKMAPALMAINEAYQEKAIVKYVDVWKNPDAATGYPVSVIPTQIFINADGTPYLPSDAVAQTIAFDMYVHKETGEQVFTAHEGGLTEEQMRMILSDMGVE